MDPAKYSAGWSRGRPKNGNGLPAIPPQLSEFIMWLYKKAIYDLKRQDNVLEIVNSGWLLNGMAQFM